MIRLFPRARFHVNPPKWRYKQVTICIGMLCTDGVIVGADTQETYGGEIGYVTKLFPFSTDKNKAIVAGAGPSHFIDYAKDRIFSDVLSTAGNPQEFEQKLRSLMLRLYADEFKKYPTDEISEKNMQLLVAAQFDRGVPTLYSADSTLVRRIYGSRLIGIETLAGMAAEFQQMRLNMSQTMWACIYLIKIAKDRYQGVGGTTHVIGIGSDGEFGWERSTDIPQREAALGRLDRLARQLLIGMIPATGKPAFDAVLDVAADFLRVTREDLEKIDADFEKDMARFKALNTRAQHRMEEANKEIDAQQAKQSVSETSKPEP